MDLPSRITTDHVLSIGTHDAEIQRVVGTQQLQSRLILSVLTHMTVGHECGYITAAGKSGYLDVGTGLAAGGFGPDPG